MSVDEMVEEVRAILADRNTSERQRLALEMLLRMAKRGRHLSSVRLPAVSTATQRFVNAREELQRGLDEIAAASATDLGPPDEDEEVR
jgi:hypothetical protein